MRAGVGVGVGGFGWVHRLVTPTKLRYAHAIDIKMGTLIFSFYLV